MEVAIIFYINNVLNLFSLEKEMAAHSSIFLPGEFHEQRSLVGYSPWGCKESDVTLLTHTQTNLFTTCLNMFASPCYFWQGCYEMKKRSQYTGVEKVLLQKQSVYYTLCQFSVTGVGGLCRLMKQINEIMVVRNFAWVVSKQILSCLHDLRGGLTPNSRVKYKVRTFNSLWPES